MATTEMLTVVEVLGDVVRSSPLLRVDLHRALGALQSWYVVRSIELQLGRAFLLLLHMWYSPGSIFFSNEQ